MHPVSILIHVPNLDVGLDWYKNAFPMATVKSVAAFNFTVLDLNGFCIEIVQADEKVGSGKCGTVMYWSVDDFEQALIHFEELGARCYRGPMKIEDGLRMCQVEDPFGNLIGLRGK
ncbi:VOC family protein [Marinomonas sp. 2405UD68-3]|uniref:VOC family protein n=1 Tax=Marinomonas sp. 2405UD68-3 TaxID=3391835 RepID=UPI0039C9EADE